jgi:peptidoglycan/xylan/chitin deacetylase (PgdA/CDA1 family)
MFRLDRFLTLYFFNPLAKRRGSGATNVPILMYHGISYAKRNGGHPYYETTTTPEMFAQQVAFLKENGYKSIGLNELAAALEKPAEPDAKPVVITFDDGLLDFYVTGLPILKANGFSATVFLPAGLMGKELAGQPIMNWDHARLLAAAGVRCGSHSATHPKLSEVSRSQLEREISESKNLIESALGIEIQSFSYPYAFPEHDTHFIKMLADLLETHGYSFGVTTSIGRASRRDKKLFLRRLPVNDYDDNLFLKAKLLGAYDWLGALQSTFKRSQRRKARLLRR